MRSIFDIGGGDTVERCCQNCINAGDASGSTFGPHTPSISCYEQYANSTCAKFLSSLKGKSECTVEKGGFYSMLDSLGINLKDHLVCLSYSKSPDIKFASLFHSANAVCSNKTIFKKCSQKSRMKRKLSTNTLHSIESLVDLRSWCSCEIEKRQYYLEELLVSDFAITD